MAKGYWIGRVDVSNDEGYKPHAPANLAIFKKFGGRFARRQVHRRRRPKPRAQRGDRIRQLRCQANIKVRQPHSIADLIVIEGCANVSDRAT